MEELIAGVIAQRSSLPHRPSGAQANVTHTPRSRSSCHLRRNRWLSWCNLSGSPLVLGYALNRLDG